MDGKTIFLSFVFPLSLCCRSCRSRGSCSIAACDADTLSALKSYHLFQRCKRHDAPTAHILTSGNNKHPCKYFQKSNISSAPNSTHHSISIQSHILYNPIPSYLFPSLRIITVFITLTFDETHNLHKHTWHTHTRVRICRCVIVDVYGQRNCAWVVCVHMCNCL
jgi:hypothetical protein